MFSWFWKNPKPSPEQLALELQALCDEYDRNFPEENKNPGFGFWHYAWFMSYGVATACYAAAALAKFAGLKALRLKFSAFGMAFWAAGDIGSMFITVLPGSPRDDAESLLLSQIEAKRQALTKALDGEKAKAAK